MAYCTAVYEKPRKNLGKDEVKSMDALRLWVPFEKECLVVEKEHTY